MVSVRPSLFKGLIKTGKDRKKLLYSTKVGIDLILVCPNLRRYLTRSRPYRTEAELDLTKTGLTPIGPSQL